VVIEDSNNVEKEASTRWGREGWWWENEQRVGCSGLVWRGKIAMTELWSKKTDKWEESGGKRGIWKRTSWRMGEGGWRCASRAVKRTEHQLRGSREMREDGVAN